MTTPVTPEDEYAPTTAEVRDYFTHGQFSDVTEREATAGFNRWLAAHDAEVRQSTPPVQVDRNTRSAAFEEVAQIAQKIAAQHRGFEGHHDVAFGAELVLKAIREALTVEAEEE